MSVEILKEIESIIKETNGECNKLGERFDKSLRWKIVAAVNWKPKEEFIAPGVNARKAEGYEEIKRLIRGGEESSSQE